MGLQPLYRIEGYLQSYRLEMETIVSKRLQSSQRGFNIHFFAEKFFWIPPKFRVILP